MANSSFVALGGRLLILKLWSVFSAGGFHTYALTILIIIIGLSLPLPVLQYIYFDLKYTTLV